jgi:hypothetical protein
LAKSLASVLELWSEQVAVGMLATADLPAPFELRNLAAWQDGWDRLSEKKRVPLLHWWHSATRLGE